MAMLGRCSCTSPQAWAGSKPCRAAPCGARTHACCPSIPVAHLRNGVVPAVGVPRQRVGCGREHDLREGHHLHVLVPQQHGQDPRAVHPEHPRLHTHTPSEHAPGARCIPVLHLGPLQLNTQPPRIHSSASVLAAPAGAWGETQQLWDTCSASEHARGAAHDGGLTWPRKARQKVPLCTATGTASMHSWWSPL